MAFCRLKMAVIMTLTGGLLLMMTASTCYGAQLPVMSGFTKVVTISETATGVIPLTTIQCTDADNDIVVVTETAISPTTLCATCFQVYPNGPATTYELQFLPEQGSLDFGTVEEYLITLECDDDNDGPVEEVIHVRLLINQPPVLTAGFFTQLTLNDVKNVVKDDVIMTVDASDNEGDPIFYELSTFPESNNFQIGYTSGIITAANDLSGECLGDLTFMVTVNDGYNTDLGPQYIEVTMNGENSAPYIANLPDTTIILETAAVGTSITNIDVTDDDSTTIVLSANPITDLQFFQLAGTELQLANTLNYEIFSQRVIKVLISATDGFCSSPTYTHTVSVADVNEPPIISPIDFTLSEYEGDMVVVPGWETYDEDLSDTKTYTLIGGDMSNFKIDRSSGTIRSTTNYNIDPNTETATVTLTVQVEDSGGLTDSTEVVIEIKDTNDNAPVFTDTSVNIAVTECTALGTAIGSVAATDEDSDHQQNDDIVFSSSLSSSSGLTLTAAGTVILNQVIPAGTSITFSVDATDNGWYPERLTSIAPASVTVTGLACPTTTTAPTTTTTTTTTTTSTTTKRQSNTSDEVDDNLWWIIIAAILGAIFLALTVFLCMTRVPYFCTVAPKNHWCRRLGTCEGMCERRQLARPRKIEVKEKEQKPQGNPPLGGNDSFWTERFQNDFYREQPDRNKTPEPMNMDEPTQEVAQPWRTTGRYYNQNSAFEL